MHVYKNHILSIPITALLTISLPSFADNYPNVADERYGDIDKTKEWFKQCMSVKDVSLPSPAIENVSLANIPFDCSKYLYYDTIIHSPSVNDWQRVQVCALKLKDFDALTMLYANGFGVEKNFRLAKHFACKSPGTPGEVETSVMSVVDFEHGRNPGPEGEPFDQCDHKLSTLTLTDCAYIRLSQAELKLDEWEERIVQSWSVAERAQLQALKTATREFAMKRTDEENSPLAHEAGIKLVVNQVEETNRLLKDLKSIANGERHEVVGERAREADDRLNSIYRVIMLIDESNHDLPFNSIQMSKVSVRVAQRAWFKYRDAWLNLVKLKYPTIDAKSWETVLTDRCTQQLSEVAKLAR